MFYPAQHDIPKINCYFMTNMTCTYKATKYQKDWLNKPEYLMLRDCYHFSNKTKIQ